jgi:lipoprotein-releasing system ATP-binding protein
MAALIATHNPELAARMDRTLRLDNGLLVDG